MPYNLKRITQNWGNIIIILCSADHLKVNCDNQMELGIEN